ncbi:MAG TPA: hypothetical protein VE863_17095 [Pyrinomonadaceae bacterium]|jgi:hypothetical protein|nr:hypothetical protein [Pyrinomonadaceae bacterium]
MKSHYLSSKTGRILLALAFLVGIGMVSTASAQNWPYNQDPNYRRDRDRDRDRDYQRNGRNGGYNNAYQIAANQGYQDGLYTGQNDAARRQNYNPQRSHFYRNGHGDNGGYGNYGRNNYQYQQAYRQGFMQGYNDGYQRYGGNRRNNGRYNRWPF